MSSPGDELFRVIGSKVGLGEDENRAIKKASELRRLVKLKTDVSRGFVHLNETCIAVLCLDLAASMLGLAFDRTTAVTMSCVGKSVYVNSLHTIEKLLGVERTVSVNSLAVQLGSPDLAPLAASYLEKFKAANPAVRLSHPMYPCAAVLAAARQSRTKVKKEIVVESCRVKTTELERLAASMAKLRGQHLVNNTENIVRESERAVAVVSREFGEEMEEENYEDWRERLLRL